MAFTFPILLWCGSSTGYRPVGKVTVTANDFQQAVELAEKEVAKTYDLTDVVFGELKN